MSDKVLELTSAIDQNDKAAAVVHFWDTYNKQRMVKLDEWNELRNYIFATDTTTTSNSKLPWKNKTTLPKLAQIRDNLHSNYISAIFPNDKWLNWKAYTRDSNAHEKANNIKAYMENKTRESKFRTTVSSLLYDYIDYGNCFVTCSFEDRYHDNDLGERIQEYKGPRAYRISPENIVFNPTAPTFQDTYKCVRSIKSVGELVKLAETNPDQSFWADAVKHHMDMRRQLSGYSSDDFRKANAYTVDGFGNLLEYYQSNYVEILEFYGDYYDPDSGELSTNRMITVVDRSLVVRDVKIPTMNGKAPIWHVGWRSRTDNLWSMGPLDNLVGMQYRIDHLENLKADAMDLVVHPPLKIMGDVEAFEWAPGAEVHLDEGGDVQEISKNMNSMIISDNQIADLEDKMELYAGAPREAMGVRSPGEKTALEVQTLNNAAGRIFQEKTITFEIELLEPLLNGMLEVSVRNFTGTDTISSRDNDLGADQFKNISKEDITAKGVIRPVGARHFAQQAQDLQTLIGIFGSALAPMLQPHTSTTNLTKFIEDLTSIKGYEIFRKGVGIEEAQETQHLANQAEEDLEVAQQVPAENLTQNAEG